MDKQQTERIRKNLRKTYDRYAAERDIYEREDWKVEERLKFLKLLQQEGRMRMLELGAGTGLDASYFQDNGIQTTCIDLSPAMVEILKRKGLNAQVMDMTDLQFPEASFEAVYSMNSLLHIAKMEFTTLLGRIRQLLAAGGLFYLGMYGGIEQEGVWQDDKYRPKRFFSFFTDEQLEEEVQKVFELLSFKVIQYDEEGRLHFQSLILRSK